MNLENRISKIEEAAKAAEDPFVLNFGIDWNDILISLPYLEGENVGEHGSR